MYGQLQACTPNMPNLCVHTSLALAFRDGTQHSSCSAGRRLAQCGLWTETSRADTLQGMRRASLRWLTAVVAALLASSPASYRAHRLLPPWTTDVRGFLANARAHSTAHLAHTSRKAWVGYVHHLFDRHALWQSVSDGHQVVTKRRIQHAGQVVATRRWPWASSIGPSARCSAGSNPERACDHTSEQLCSCPHARLNSSNTARCPLLRAWLRADAAEQLSVCAGSIPG